MTSISPYAIAKLSHKHTALSSPCSISPAGKAMFCAILDIPKPEEQWDQRIFLFKKYSSRNHRASEMCTVVWDWDFSFRVFLEWLNHYSANSFIQQGSKREKNKRTMKQRYLAEEDTTSFKLLFPPNTPLSQLIATLWASLCSWDTECGTGKEKISMSSQSLSTTQHLHSESDKSQPHITNCRNKRGLYDTAAKKVEQEQVHEQRNSSSVWLSTWPQG